MRAAKQLFFILSLTIFAIATFVLTLFNYNPYEAESSIFSLFYLSLLFSLTGVLSLALIYVKFKIKKNVSFGNIFWPSVRQAFFLSGALSLLLFLLGLNVLDKFVGISLLIVIILLELFFQTKKN